MEEKLMPDDFAGVPIFKGLTTNEIAEVLATGSIRECTKGERIIEEGTPGDAFYVIISGRVAVKKRSNGEEKTLAILEKKACFGEMAMISNKPRVASVYAEADLKLISISIMRFNELIHRGCVSCQKIIYNMARVLSDRLGKMEAPFMKILALTAELDTAEKVDEVKKFRTSLETEWTI